MVVAAEEEAAAAEEAREAEAEYSLGDRSPRAFDCDSTGVTAGLSGSGSRRTARRSSSEVQP